MTSNLENGYRPEKAEETTEIREITPLQRDYFFHREPYMSLNRFGYITITWTGPHLANFDYYEVLANFTPGARHNAENAIETWANGNTPNPDKGYENIFAYRWSAYSIFYKPDNTFVLGSKNDKGVTLLKVIAAQNPESATVSDVSIEPEVTPGSYLPAYPVPAWEDLDLDPQVASFFDSLEEAVKQSKKDKSDF